jgi:transposase
VDSGADDATDDENQAIGVSRGGKNTKIHAVVDALGNPVKLLFTAGNVSDTSTAISLISEVVDISASIVLADKAYGSKAIRRYIESRGASYCIPPKSNAKSPWECDYVHYKERHVVECFFQKIKAFRHVATRYDKLLQNFKSFTYLACIMVLLK